MDELDFRLFGLLQHSTADFFETHLKATNTQLTSKQRLVTEAHQLAGSAAVPGGVSSCLVMESTQILRSVSNAVCRRSPRVDEQDFRADLRAIQLLCEVSHVTRHLTTV